MNGDVLAEDEGLPSVPAGRDVEHVGGLAVLYDREAVATSREAHPLALLAAEYGVVDGVGEVGEKVLESVKDLETQGETQGKTQGERQGETERDRERHRHETQTRATDTRHRETQGDTGRHRETHMSRGIRVERTVLPC